MLHSLSRIMFIGCFALPLASFGAADRPSNGDTKDTVKADQELAKKIQKKMAKDDSLSADAPNVNVSVQNSAVTLTGTVRSDAVSQSIQGKAESLLIQETPSERIPR